MPRPAAPTFCSWTRSPAGYPSAEAFLTELTLDPPDATSDQAGVPLKDEDYLILSTIHSAKGQEWKSVYLLNAVDGCIPSDLGTGSTRDLEEERRLLYVAMTRAKDELTLGLPLRFYVTQQAKNGDRHVYAMRTRFIPKEILDRFEAFHWSPAQQGGAGPPRTGPDRRGRADARDVGVGARPAAGCLAREVSAETNGIRIVLAGHHWMMRRLSLGSRSMTAARTMPTLTETTKVLAKPRFSAPVRPHARSLLNTRPRRTGHQKVPIRTS